MAFEKTGLWKNSLGTLDQNVVSVERLRNSFLSFREKAGFLTSQIDKNLPDLTIHNLTHLDALWEIADTIAGEGYPLNPLEAYIFGGAILLHDSALCFEAYEGGLDGIRKTITWQDAYSLEKKSRGDESEQKKRADFIAVRNLHAPQAEVLATKSWKSPEGDQINLIDDDHLRNHFGPIIGQIAASHHWDIEKVGATFSKVRNSSSEFPKEWQFDPLKIACMLRCADAGHLDAKRAPDFLLALLKRNGISEDHWRSQNYLARVGLDPDDENNLMINSTKAFTRKEADAWWVAFDAISLLNKELIASNAILKNHNRLLAPELKAKRVLHANNPSKLRELVQAVGWEPVDAQLHISNIEALIEKLGGDLIYGENDKAGVVIRELIQNARDSIRARQEIEKSYRGKILIKLENLPNSQKIIVDDNGVGMSKRVLLGPFIDFGNSFWTSSLISREFPGLVSSKFKSAGRFGIGFFSVFMIADHVLVYSRRFDESLDSFKMLEFSDGISLRPLFADHKPSDADSNLSSRVELTLAKDSFLENSSFKHQVGPREEGIRTIRFQDYVATMVAALDVDVDVIIDGKLTKSCFAFPPEKSKYRDWMDQISLGPSALHPDKSEQIDKDFERLRPIYTNGRQTGLAALSSSRTNQNNMLSKIAVDGLINPYGAHGNFVGVVATEPKTVKREHSFDPSEAEGLTEWLEVQQKLMAESKSSLSTLEKFNFMSSLAAFKCDPISFLDSLYIKIKDGNILEASIDWLTQQIIDTPLLFVTMRQIDMIDQYYSDLVSGHHFQYVCVHHGPILRAKLIDGKPMHKHSLLDCLDRIIRDKGLKPIWTEKENVGQSLTGVADGILLEISK